jgi:NMD protein affecting ribosome stability and mRNA decay
MEDETLSESGCCDGWSSLKSEVNGICPDCGIETVNGVAAYGCNWSPVLCKTCGYAGCDGSC